MKRVNIALFFKYGDMLSLSCLWYQRLGFCLSQYQVLDLSR